MRCIPRHMSVASPWESTGSQLVHGSHSNKGGRPFHKPRTRKGALLRAHLGQTPRNGVAERRPESTVILIRDLVPVNLVCAVMFVLEV
jgi:hypothetical protein